MSVYKILSGTKMVNTIILNDNLATEWVLPEGHTLEKIPSEKELKKDELDSKKGDIEALETPTIESLLEYVRTLHEYLAL